MCRKSATLAMLEKLVLDHLTSFGPSKHWNHVTEPTGLLVMNTAPERRAIKVAGLVISIRIIASNTTETAHTLYATTTNTTSIK